MDTDDANGLLKRYLLGQLSEEAQLQLEEQYLEGGELYEQLIAAENELADAYVRGELVGAERAHFEKHFLQSPERVENVSFARAFRAAVDQAVEARARSPVVPSATTTHPRRTTARVATAVLAAACVIGILALALEDRALKNELKEIHSQQMSLEHRLDTHERELIEWRESINKPIPEAPPSPEPNELPAPKRGSSAQAPLIASLDLRSDVMRGSGAGPLLRIPSGSEQVQLNMEFASPGNGKYEVALSTPEGRSLWSKTVFAARGSRPHMLITVMVPARLFQDSDYILTVQSIGPDQAAETAAEYSFRVKRERSSR